MGIELIRLGAGALRHILGVLLLAWRRIVRTAGTALIAGIVVTELVGSLVTHHFPPYLLTHVVALAIGIVVAYCVALMVLVDELLKGTFDLVRLALGEVEAGARAAEIIAEREVGEVWGWARRLAAGRDAVPENLTPRPRLVASPRTTTAGRTPTTAASGGPRASARTLGQFPLPRTTTGAPSPAAASDPTDPARLRVPPRLGVTHPPASAPAPRDETRDDIAATDVFRKTAPPTPANAHPVRADQLPRIEWAAEGLAAGAALLESALAARARHARQGSPADHSHSPTPAPTTDETPLEAMPPLPRRSPAATSENAANTPTSGAPPSPLAAPVSDSSSAVAAAAPATVPLAPPLPPHAPATVPLAPPAVERAAASPTMPLAPDPDPPGEQATAPRPFPRPSSPVRTVPVITDAATTAALEAAAPETVAQPAQAPVDPAPATPGAPADDAGGGAPAEDAAEAPDAAWEPPHRVVVLPAAEGQTPRASRATGNTDGVWPDEDEQDGERRGAEERGLWSRIGQALVRSTTRPLRERGDDGEGDGEGDATPDRHA